MRYNLLPLSLILLLLLALTSWYKRKAASKQESRTGRPQGIIGWSLFIGCLVMVG